MTRIDDLRALAAAATPGPWEVAAEQADLLRPVAGRFQYPDDDAALIAALRNHADALLDCAAALAAAPAAFEAAMTDPTAQALADWWREKAAPALVRLEAGR